MRFSLAAAATSVLALASFASAQSVITAPAPDIWWVAKSNNVLEWDCKNFGYDKFTVMIHREPMPSPLAVIAIQDNTQCSLLVTSNQFNVEPGTGYRILFGNIVNNTDVYTTSEEFEVKPLGSLYPTQQAEREAALASRSSAAAAASASAAGESEEDGSAISSAASKVAVVAGAFAAAFAML